MSNPSQSISSRPPDPQGKKLLEQLSEALRNRHYSLRTEKPIQTFCNSFATHVLQRGGLAVKSPLDS